MSDKRLTAAMAMLTRESDGEALSALRQVTRMLEERGLDWTKVAEKITGRALGDVMAPAGAQANQPVPQPANGMASAFADIFAGSMFAAKPTAPRPAEPKPVRKRYVDGAGIPAQVRGTIEVDDERAWRGGVMAIVTVRDEAGGTVYGPMTVFDAELQQLVKNAARQVFDVRVRQPSKPNQNPVVFWMSPVD